MGIFWNFLTKNKSKKRVIASALGHVDISRSIGAVQVKPDKWGPHVSDTGLVSVADTWA